MFLIIVAAFVGLLAGGPRGLLVGALLGYVLHLVARRWVQRSLRRLQTQFVESTFALVGAVCKADGVVTRDEIQFAEDLFEKLHLTAEQVIQAKAAFGRGKAPQFDLEAEIDQLLQVSPGSRALSPFFLRVLVIAVAADGTVDPAEHALLLRVATRLQLSAREVAELEAMLRMIAGTSQQSSANSPPQGQVLQDAYAILGVGPDATDAEVKRCYRKQMKENHPDKVAAKGLPENMRSLAEGRAREINAAYDLIKRARGMS